MDAPKRANSEMDAPHMHGLLQQTARGQGKAARRSSHPAQGKGPPPPAAAATTTTTPTAGSPSTAAAAAATNATGAGAGAKAGEGAATATVTCVFPATGNARVALAVPLPLTAGGIRDAVARHLGLGPQQRGDVELVANNARLEEPGAVGRLAAAGGGVVKVVPSMAAGRHANEADAFQAMMKHLNLDPKALNISTFAEMRQAMARLARHTGPAGLPLGPGPGGAGQLRCVLQAMEQAGAKVHLARPPGAGSGGGGAAGGADDAGEEVVLGAAELEAFMQSQGLSLDDIAVGPGVAMGLGVGPGAGCHGHGHGEAAEPGAKEELRRLLRGVQAGAVDVNSKEVALARQAVADEARALERRMRDNRKTTRTLEALREKRRAAKLRRERKRRAKAQRPGPADGGGGGGGGGGAHVDAAGGPSPQPPAAAGKGAKKGFAGLKKGFLFG